MTKPACKDCRFWNLDEATQEEKYLVSECRRRAPLALEQFRDWPRTTGCEWCGEFKPRVQATLAAGHVDVSALHPWSEFWNLLSSRCKNAIAMEAERRKLKMSWETWCDVMAADWAIANGAVDWGSRKSVRRCMPSMRNFGDVCADQVIDLMAESGWPFRD